MRKFLMICFLALIALASCKQLDEKRIQLSSKSKNHQQELLKFANHDEGIHYVQYDTINFMLIVKHDFETENIQKVFNFIKENQLDSIPPVKEEIEAQVSEETVIIEKDSSEEILIIDSIQ